MTKPGDEENQETQTTETEQGAGGFGTATALSTDEAESAAGGEQSSSAGQKPSAADDTFQLPTELLGEDGTLSPDKVTEHLKAQATDSAERLEKYGEVPEGDYDLTIDVKGDDDQPLQIDPENPYLKQFVADAKEMGIGQKAMTGLLTRYAESVTQEIQTLAPEIAKSVIAGQRAEIDKEIASLGDSGETRIKAATTVLGELLNEEQAAALMNTVRTRKAFEAVEAMIDLARGDSTENPNLNGEKAESVSDAEVLYSGVQT